MAISKRRVAVLDANVLYPAPLRDFLLRLAENGICHPKWSDQIHEEWTGNLLANRPDLKPSQLKRTCQLMDGVFDEANVKGFNSLIDILHLPDRNDRHVLAVAIKSGADVILTFNKKDFPSKALQPYSIIAQGPDEFVESLIKTDAFKVLKAFGGLVSSLKNPPQTGEQVLVTLEGCGLTKSVALIRESLG